MYIYIYTHVYNHSYITTYVYIYIYNEPPQTGVNNFDPYPAGTVRLSSASRWSLPEPMRTFLWCEASGGSPAGWPCNLSPGSFASENPSQVVSGIDQNAKPSEFSPTWGIPQIPEFVIFTKPYNTTKPKFLKCRFPHCWSNPTISIHCLVWNSARYPQDLQFSLGRW